jgi:small subunit ribosomal protein S18
MSGPDRPVDAPRGERDSRGGDRDSRGGGGDFRGGGGDFRGGGGDFRGGGGDRDYRGGDRDYRGDRDGPRGEQSVKSRLRAKARKKARKQRKKGFVRRKVCRFCADSSLPIDYPDAKTLRLFVSETGKMIPRRISGNCARHQRPLALAIKRARHLALLPTSANYL